MKKIRKLRSLLAGAISILAAATSAANPLPAIYINTNDPDADINREEYIGATYYLEANGAEGVQNIGSAEAPLPLQFRGRGNWTWVGYDKKPYRLLLDTPASVAGLKSNDYFGLHAHADDNLGFMRNTLGFELARRLGIDWTPSHSPVELYLNGDYRGLYFCTELVRVEPDRVNVFRQDDNDNSDPTGGWLIEIDNYDTDPHITLTEGNGQKIIFSHKTPLALSPEQEQFLRSQMQAIDDAVYAEDKNVAAWADLVDIDRLARFYIVHELMDNTEAFHGSCFLHRDRGQDAKWMFGPVWDFGSSFFRGSGKFIWQDANYTLTWIKEMYTFPDFQNKIKEIWAQFCVDGYDGIDEFLRSQGEVIKDAAARDIERWPAYGNADIDASVRKVSYMLANKTRWLGQQWGAVPAAVPENVEIFLRGTLNNWGTSNMLMPQDDGTYTLELASLTDLFKIASSDWSTVEYGGDGVTSLKANTVYKLVSGSVSKNISVWGEIKDAKITLDPIAQTLLVEGTQIEPVVEETIPVYFRGDMNKWGTDMEFTKLDDGTYTLDIEKLNGKFKIADAKFKEINLGGDNVTPIEPGVPYKLIKSGKNISLSRDVDKARMDLDLDGKTLLLTDLSTVGVEAVSIDRNSAPARIITLQGRELPAGAIPAPGVYIVIDKAGHASKSLFR
ncbi:MAG: CotH kinase family protein [Muribaculaceae bacterium]|nr:CotH kinase family protein [Muribaculaceae bacterium]